VGEGLVPPVVCFENYTERPMHEFLAVTLFMFLAAMAPGADFALVVRNSLIYSRRAACYTALGIGAGLGVHTTYSVLGLAMIIAGSATLFAVIKYAGAGYLCYLGVRSFMQGGGPESLDMAGSAENIGALRAFRQGFLCNVLNPKAPLIYIAFYSVVLPANTGLIAKALYGAEFMIVVGGWFVLLACAISHHAVKRGLGRVQKVLTKVLGGMMFYFGIRLALAEG